MDSESVLDISPEIVHVDILMVVMEVYVKPTKEDAVVPL